MQWTLTVNSDKTMLEMLEIIVIQKSNVPTAIHKAAIHKAAIQSNKLLARNCSKHRKSDATPE